MDLNGKVALVTGGSRGIGRAVAIRLAAEGARVVINYRQDAAAAEAVQRSIGNATIVQADVSDGEQVRRMMDTVGPVDILVNNAGMLRRGDLGDFDFSQMDPMRRTNVDGVVHCTRGVIEGMKARGWGRIVNLTSIAASGTSLPGTTFYAATKAAVVIMTKRFAMELGPHGITVNAVAPGFIMTDMTDGGPIEGMAARAMVRRVGQPEDIAHVIAFLVSPKSSFITAQVMTVDGGRTDYIGHN